MNIKERIKQWLTTTIGLTIIVGALALFIMNKIDSTELGTALVLGWTYLAAKDSLLSGVSAGLIKTSTNNEEEVK